MTPQEQDDYKRTWMMLDNHPVRLHSDLVNEAKPWCRRNVERHRWSFESYTDVYEHTFYFELAEHAQEFMLRWPDYTNQTMI